MESVINNITNWIKDYFVNNGPDCKAIVGISGGKDSTVTAALLVKALGKNRVIGVKMPQGNQHDIDVANKVIDYLDIDSYEVNIDEVCKSLYNAIDIGYNFEGSVESIPQIASNSPARIRMTVLYAIAAREHGRVANLAIRARILLAIPLSLEMRLAIFPYCLNIQFQKCGRLVKPLVSLTSLSLKRQKMVLVVRLMKITLALPMTNSTTSYCEEIIPLMMFIRILKSDISAISTR